MLVNDEEQGLFFEKFEIHLESNLLCTGQLDTFVSFYKQFPQSLRGLKIKKSNALLTGGIYVFHFIINKILINKKKQPLSWYLINVLFTVENIK